MRTRPTTALFAIFIFSYVVRAQSSAIQPSAPSIQQAMEMKSVSNPQISPDGKFVAYQVTHTDWDQNAFVQQIWLANVSTGETFPLTEGAKSSTDPTWSPDGRWLAFLSSRESSLPNAKKDTAQIYLISPTGGEARQITNVETGVESFDFSPDARHIAFTSPDPETDAHKARVKKYGDYHIIDSDYTMSHLWLIDVPAPDAAELPKPARLTSGNDFTVGDFRWSPDSTRIAFTASKDPALADGGTANIYVLTVADKSVRKLLDAGLPNQNPVWSPDGSQIAFNTANGNPYFFYANSVIDVVPASGGAPKVLTADFDEDARAIAWSPEGIYFEAGQRTY